MVEKKRQRTRAATKIDGLPEAAKTEINRMLADIHVTYEDITKWLSGQGYDISRSAVGRYALRGRQAAQKLLEAQEQTKALMEAVRKNPDVDYTEGAMQIISGELTKKLAIASEEWDEMPLEKATQVMVALSRTKSYKDKVRAELAQKTKAALDEFKKEVYAELETAEPEICERLVLVANRVAEGLAIAE